jgi:hypothetical protein
MLAAQLLDHFAASGVRLELRAGTLRAGPRDALTPGVRGLIADHRPELLRLLGAPETIAEGTPTTPPVPQTMACRACAHYLPDPSGDGGLGVCRVAAPASLRPGSLWPGSTPNCQLWECTP